MKKLMVVLAAVVVLGLIPSLPAVADAPEMENWSLGGSSGGLVEAGYWINTTNLQVDRFWLHNMSEDTRVLRIINRQDECIFELIAIPGTDYIEQEINNFKFQRLPATDPDDPNSIRYPPQVKSIGVGYLDMGSLVDGGEYQGG